MRNADRLVRKLVKLGVIIDDWDVFGASFQIYRHQHNEHFNRATGEAAPTWELLCAPHRAIVLGRTVILRNGTTPTFTMPDGSRHTTEIYSHFPLTHILRTPLDDWDIGMDDCDRPRLWVGTKMLPSTW